MASKANGRTGASGKSTGGGGINSRQHVKTPIRTGAPAKGVNPGAVSYLGNKLGNHSMDRGSFPLKGTPWNGRAPVSAAVPLGNQTSLLGAGSGAKPGGAGRVVSPSGSQGCHSGTGAAIGTKMLPQGGK